MVRQRLICHPFYLFNSLQFEYFRLKFDDDRVTPATLKEVLEENYGGEPQGVNALNTRPNIRTIKRFTNAYMLVYLRECMMDEILNDVTTADIPPHLSKYTHGPFISLDFNV